jgi:hypothetical protein
MCGESVDREDIDNAELYINCYVRDRQRIESEKNRMKDMIIDIDG